MAIKQPEKVFASYVVDLMQSMGPVRWQRMFGGFGLFLEDLMFALIADNVLYLKVDAALRSEFEESGLRAFSYSKNGKEYRMSYFQAPEETLEDAESMNLWAAKAYGAALRAAAKKSSKVAKAKGQAGRRGLKRD